MSPLGEGAWGVWQLARTLLSKEELTFEDVKRLIGPPPYAKNFVESVELILPKPDQPIPEP